MVASLTRDPADEPDLAARLMKNAFSHLENELLEQKPLCILLAPEWRRSRDKPIGNDALVSIAGVVRSLGEISPPQKNWDTILSNMLQIPILQPDNAPVYRSAVLPLPKALGLIGNCDSSVTDQVRSWFTALIEDQDILDSIAIDSVTLADSASRIGAQLRSRWFRGIRRETVFLDINVLRFPDADHPFFELYKLKVDAWMQRWPFFSLRRSMNGLTGVFQAYKFQPQKSIINELSPQTLDKAIQEAEALLDSKGQLLLAFG
ncbi:uncharacterized protein PHACADRAFT_193471 [Phanerochaete carnosa HHB-10118-sp]|uniref:Uncharacterized protein n=1 Tax=Phanerochaete carnosa (strain HHB-10118-sp) TaxID=650164 RepID=K5WGZ5_PHACS|nr:uncharacterized protein PHACADRAFT_193471 [Phanerochaete carnosa HHB-10118-sp]EKM58349.1 hypothetical protein PHACADRAFT_193471 [Phanerochaete carnosa HHB-10118-sp]